MELPETLGLEFAKDLETFTIFSPDSTENKYNHGVVLYPFKGMLLLSGKARSKMKMPLTLKYYLVAVQTELTGKNQKYLPNLGKEV